MKLLKLALLTLALSACDKIIANPLIGSISWKNNAIDPKPGVFIFMGQSNMSGENPNYMGSSPAEKIVLYNNPGNGPILTIAQNIHYTNRIIVVNCSLGGSFIAQWQPGLRQFDTCIAMAQDAVLQSSAVVRGIFWEQGEADSQPVSNGATTYDYAQAFYVIANALRSHWNVPLIIGRIGLNARGPSVFPLWQHVRDEIDSIRLPNSIVVDTDNATLMSDGIHHDADGYVSEGLSLANGFNKLILD